MQNYKIKIDGMHCAGCARRVEAALKSIKGQKVKGVDLENKCALISAKALDEALIKEKIEELGFRVTEIVGEGA